MIDMHSHILFDVDDGSKSLEQSVKMAEASASIGFRRVLATPHYIGSTDFNNPKADNAMRLQQLNAKV